MCTNTARVVKTYKGQKGKKKKEKKNLPENNIVSIIGHQFILHTKHLCTFLCQEEAIQSRSSPEAVEANSARRTDKSPQHVPILSHEKLYDNKIFPSSSIQQTSAVGRAGRCCSTAHDVRDAAGDKERIMDKGGYPDTEQESIVGVEVEEEEDGQ